MLPVLSESLTLPGATLVWGDDHYVLHLERSFQFLSSAALGEGLLKASWVFSQQVDAATDLDDAQAYLRYRARLLGIPAGEPCVGLLTAVSHQDLQVLTAAEAQVTVATIATVGVDHGTSPRQRQVISYGDTQHGEAATRQGAGTINTVTLVGADLTPGALVRASTIATEAKTLALVEAGKRTREGYIPTGTVTDVSVVGHSGRGHQFEYAGAATLVGWLVGHTTYLCVKRGLAAYNKRKQLEELSVISQMPRASS